jgi:hypothetical protein
VIVDTSFSMFQAVWHIPAMSVVTESAKPAARGHVVAFTLFQKFSFWSLLLSLHSPAGAYFDAFMSGPDVGRCETTATILDGRVKIFRSYLSLPPYWMEG